MMFLIALGALSALSVRASHDNDEFRCRKFSEIYGGGAKNERHHNPLRS